MKITVTKSELHNKLKLVGRFIAPNKVNQQYESFLFERRGEILQVAAADEGGWIKTIIEHTSDTEEFLFSVNAKTFLDGINQIPEQPLVISLTDKNTYYDLLVEYAGGRFSMCAGIHRIFETKEERKPGDVVTSISSINLLYGLRRTYFRAASDELRPVMNGVYLELADASFTFVASDGHTLATMEYFGNVERQNSRSGVILAKKLCKVLIDAIPPEDAPMEYFTSGTNIVFGHPQFTVSYRMVEGKYPNFRAVIPKNNTNIASIDRNIFISLLKRVLVFSNKNTNLIKLSFQDGKLQGNAVDMDYSMSASEEMPIEYSGNYMSIGFNGVFLLDLISNIQTSDSIKILLSDPTRAAIITGDAPTDAEQLTYIIMPMSI